MRRHELKRAEFDRLASELAASGLTLEHRTEIRGLCMEPFLRDGDTLVIQHAADLALAPGDVVVWERADGTLPAHRLIRILSSGSSLRYVTRGDAALFADEPFAKERIRGRVVAVERAGRRLDISTAGARWRARCWHALHPLTPWLARQWRRIMRRL